jgi:hypothetical protein
VFGKKVEAAAKHPSLLRGINGRVDAERDEC